MTLVLDLPIKLWLFVTLITIGDATDRLYTIHMLEN